MRSGNRRRRIFLAAGYLLLVGLLILFTASGYVLYRQWQTAREIAIAVPPGIQSMERITLGGVDQQIYLRGRDRSNPVLLFVHGGPGASEMVPVRHYNRALEEHFVVVGWDQRGTGRSYRGVPTESITLRQIVDDALELSLMLRDRFDGKIFLVGHSWGSIVGVHAAHRRPDLYHAYIGVGQAVNFVEAEKLSYQFTLDRARELGNERSLRELESIGPPPYTGADFADRIGVQRKWLFQFGGEVYGETDNLRYLADLLQLHLYAPEYSVVDIINWVRGNHRSGQLLWEELLATDLPRQVPELAVPAYFLVGRHDYVTVASKVVEYYESLLAPHKELFWFEASAHSPNFEQPEEFAETLLRIRKRHLAD